MINKILHTIECHNMLSPNDKIVIGLSGGADSMALAFFLNSIKSEWNFDLQIAHVNHGIRGDEASRDENFVVNWCEKNGLPWKVLNVDVIKLAQEQKISTELCGRNTRYEFFRSFGNDWKIATAHNLNDSVETILFNLTRGTSTKGLRGIPPTRENIVRPLIDCSRSEIEEFCKENNVDFVLDSTNLKNDYSRNMIRNKIVPVLKELNPAMESAFSRLISSVESDCDYLDKNSAKLFEKCFSNDSLSVDLLKHHEFALRSRVIEMYIKKFLDTDISSKLIFRIDDIIINGGKIQINKDLSLKKFKNKLILENLCDTKSFLPQIVNKLNVTSEIFFNDCDNYKKFFDFCGDYDKIIGSAVVRTRQEGDSINLSGRNCTKSLKKYFNEIGIPQQNRKYVPVLVDDVGVIAVAGFAIDSRVEICNKTKNILLVKLGEAVDE